MDISLVIPCRNDPAGLRKLLTQVRGLNFFSEAIVVDDASEDDISLKGLGLDVGLFSIPLRYIRLSEHGGAGHARNVGLDHVTGSHVIFFDSDDLFGEEINKIVSATKVFLEVDNEGFDFLIFRHHDSRVTDRRGSFEGEEKYWLQVEATATPRLLSSSDAAKLCQIAAYPWNKIYNVNFLRTHELRCTELPVHNDLELHWNSFIMAKRILCTTLIGAEHFVAEDGNRLTNRKDVDRLRVFEAFENVFIRLRQSHNMPSMLEAFTEFAAKLIRWIDANLHDDFQDELKRRAGRFFLEKYAQEHMVLLAYRNPALARRINETIMRGTK